MIRSVKRLLLAGVIATSAAFAPATQLTYEVADTKRTAITTVLFNPRTKNLEIMHRFHLHDAEHAVEEIFGKGADIIKSDETRQNFAKYISDRFAILNGDTEEQLSLKDIGYEIEGKFIWVYQETPAPTTSSLIIAHNALRDLWPDQMNTVNVEGDFGVQSAQFVGSVELAKIELKTKKKKHSH